MQEERIKVFEGFEEKTIIKIMQSVIRREARRYLIKNSSDRPYGIEQVKLNADGQPNIPDLCQKIHDDMLVDIGWNEFMIVFLKKFPEKFTPAFIQGVLTDASFRKSLDPEDIAAGKLADVIMERSEEERVNLIKASQYNVHEIKDGEGKLFKLRIPKDEPDMKKTGEEETPNTNETHVGKKVYFSPAGHPVVSGRVTGHGKQGVRIRDKKNKAYVLEHGKYAIHEPDPDDLDFGSEDFGKEPKPEIKKSLLKSFARGLEERLTRSKKEQCKREGVPDAWVDSMDSIKDSNSK